MTLIALGVCKKCGGKALAGTGQDTTAQLTCVRVGLSTQTCMLATKGVFQHQRQQMCMQYVVGQHMYVMGQRTYTQCVVRHWSVGGCTQERSSPVPEECAYPRTQQQCPNERYHHANDN